MGRHARLRHRRGHRRPGRPARVHRLLNAGVPSGVLLLPAWTFGRRAVVGPLTAPGAPGCWSCAALRLGANAEDGEAAELWSGVALPGPVPASGPEPGRPLSAMLGNLLGYEVFRITTRALAPETEGQVIVQDMESLDVVAEPCCRTRAARTASTRPSRTAPAEQTPPVASRSPRCATVSPPGSPHPVSTVETAREADDVVAELNERTVLVKPHAGVFTAFDDERLTQTPLSSRRCGSRSATPGAAGSPPSTCTMSRAPGSGPCSPRPRCTPRALRRARGRTDRPRTPCASTRRG
ncbi:TOMM precursor leader peptide-binding protein [Streptomyces sp. M19]